MTIASPSDGPEQVPVYTRRSEAAFRSKVVGFDRYSGDLKLQSGATVSDFVLHVAVNPGFPQQVANFLAPLVAYHVEAEGAAGGDARRADYARYYNCINYGSYVQNKIAAAAFFYGAARLLQVSSSGAPSLALFGSIANFRLGTCGLLSDAYGVVDYYRAALRDSVHVEKSYLLTVRWILWGLLLDPNADYIQQLVQPYMQDRLASGASPSIQSSQLYLSTDWRFYAELKSLIQEKIQSLFLDFEQAPKALRPSSSINLAKLLAQIPHTPKNIQTYQKVAILVKAASLERAQQQQQDWCRALKDRFPDFSIAGLAALLDVIVIADPRVTLGLISAQANHAVAFYNKYRASFFSAPVLAELQWNEDAFYLDSMIKSKWILF